MDQIFYPSLEALFRPKSIAVVGATEDPGRVAGLPLKYALDHGYKGKLFPVNRGRDAVRGLTCYPSVLDIPEEVDVAMIVVPSATVRDVVAQCAQKGVKAVVIGVSGFAELDSDGKKLQDEIVEIARKSNMRICGPNTNGLLNVHEHISLGYSFAQEVVLPGRLGYVTQSGALLSASVPRFSQRGIGMSYFVNAGNQADLEVTDYIHHLLDDPNTDVIATYIEGFNNPRKFPDVAALALAKRKPIVMLKVGRSDLATKAAQSHTGSIVGSDAVVDAICKQQGVARVDDFDELIAVSSVFLTCKPPKGQRIGVVTSSGGAIGMIADRAMGTNLVFQDVTKKTKEEAAKLLPWYGEFRSPFDIAAAGSRATQDLELARAAVNFVIDDEGIDLLLAVITPMDRRGTRNYLQAIVEASARSTKPVILFNPMADFREGEGELLKDAPIPVLNDAAECVKAIDALVKYGRRLDRREAEEKPKGPAKMTAAELTRYGRKTLTERESKAILARYGIASTKEALAASLDEALKLAREIGYPVALKVESADIPHKTEAGGIALDVRDEAGLRQAYERIFANAARHAPKAAIDGVLVQEMAGPGHEVIIGLSTDPQFGPVVAFGLGGTVVELLRDVSLRPVPLSRQDAEEMVREIKGYRLLEGFRGSMEADVPAIVEALLALSEMSLDLGGALDEIDINPLIVGDKGKGAKAADALVVLGSGLKNK